MSSHRIEKRFGMVAVEKGFITADQLIEAMTIQISEDLEKAEHRAIGQILVGLGYLNFNQIVAILETLGFPPGFCRAVTRQSDHQAHSAN
jgi:hypothetical protein